MKQLGFRTLYVVSVISAATVASLAVNDYFRLGLGPLSEGPPSFGPYHLVRSFLMVSCSVMLIFAVWMTRRTPAERSLKRTNILPVYASAIAAITAALAFLWSPAAFSWMAREGRFVEWASAATLFLTGVTFLLAAFRIHSREGNWGGGGGNVCVALALLMFLIGMEEISWTQGIVGFETPEFFDSNRHNETNLHNFFTDTAENLYYGGAFLVLIVVPYLNEAYRLAVGTHPLADVVPERSVALIAAPFTAFNWDMWNVIPIQTTFYLTVVMLLVLLWDAVSRRDEEMYAVFATVFAMLFVQGVFLVFGDQLVRDWDATEYKELFIPLAFFFYSLGVAAKTGTVKALDSGDADIARKLPKDRRGRISAPKRKSTG